MSNLIIIGASGHGKVCADIAKLNGYKDICFFDDDISISECNGYKVVGTTVDYKKYIDFSEFFVAIGNSNIRERIMEELLNAGCKLIILRHPNAVIANAVKIGVGSVLMAGTIINTDCKIGAGCIINTSSSVDHDCMIGDYSHIAVGAHLCGGVEIGRNTWIGAGAIVSNNVKICDNCMIGAGAVAVKNIEWPGTYIGVPAKIKSK